MREALSVSKSSLYNAVCEEYWELGSVIAGSGARKKRVKIVQSVGGKLCRSKMREMRRARVYGEIVQSNSMYSKMKIIDEGEVVKKQRGI